MNCNRNVMQDKYEKHRKIFIFTFVLYIIFVIIGIIFYMVLFDLEWFDAFYATTLVLTTISIEHNAITTGQKLFIIIYSTLSIVILLSLAGSASKYILDIFVDY